MKERIRAMKEYMNEYRYNVFVEDVMHNVFSDVTFDKTDIYDRAIFTMIKSFLCYYYDMIAYTEQHDRERKACNCIHTIHHIASYSFSNTDFMLLCDCINEINKHCDVQFVIEFDDYDDIDCATYFFRATEQQRVCRQTDAYFDYHYCDINIDAYIAQYMRIYI